MELEIVGIYVNAFILPARGRTACYTDNGDNFSFAENLDLTVCRYSYIYISADTTDADVY